MGVYATGSIFYGVRLRSSQVIDLRRRCNDDPKWYLLSWLS
jgi:hypothetical protein